MEDNVVRPVFFLCIFFFSLSSPSVLIVGLDCGRAVYLFRDWTLVCECTYFIFEN